MNKPIKILLILLISCINYLNAQKNTSTKQQKIDSTVACTICDSKGIVDCNQCSLGKTTCRACHGSGDYKCTTCNGRGTDNKGVSCSSCRGAGVMRCSSCSGNGEIKCSRCNGNQKVSCNSCKGKGYRVVKVKATNNN
jgi:DnaJ-class molecular chaperone